MLLTDTCGSVYRGVVGDSGGPKAEGDLGQTHKPASAATLQHLISLIPQLPTPKHAELEAH